MGKVVLDFISLDVLKLAGVFPRLWRRIRGKTSRRSETILRHNIAGLEIVIVNNGGKVINSTIEVDRMQGTPTADGTVELLFFSIDVERLIESE